MDKESVSLDVVYERVQEKDEVSVKIDHDSNVELDVKSVEESSSECKKNKKKSVVWNCCACIGIFTSLMIFICSVLMIIVFWRSYLSVKQCFYSKENVLKESSINLNYINNIHFDVITGLVNVGFHNKPTIDIKLWDKARSKFHFHHRQNNTFDSGIVVNNSTITIHSLTSAFNHRSCIHSSIEILIPYNYSRLISLTGNVKLGYVHINGGNGTTFFSNIDITTTVGKIVVESVVANTLHLTTELGAIQVSSAMVAKEVKLNTHMGSIGTSSVYTTDFHATNHYGCSVHHDIIADNVKVETKYGYSSIRESVTFASEQNIFVNTHYGNSILSLDTNEVNFTISTPKGNSLLEYDDDYWTCKVNKSQFSSLNGNCIIQQTKVKKLVNLDMRTKYGYSTFILERTKIIAL